MKALTLGESLGLLVTNGYGELQHHKSLDLRFGGAESNVAIALARFGHDVTWMSRLGRDQLGALIAAGVQGQSVKLYVEWDNARATGLMLRDTPRAGSSRVVYYRSGSAASAINTDFVEGVEWDGTDLFHTSGITLSLSDSAESAVSRSLEIAKNHSAVVSFDINFRSRLTTREKLRKSVLHCLKNIDFLFGSEDELAILSPASHNPEEAAREIVDSFGCTVVVKRGEDGAVAYSTSDQVDYRGLTVTSLDPVGAGDAFVGGFLAHYFASKDLAKALEVGHLTGALSTLAPGDWEGQPSPEDLFEQPQDVIR